MCTEKGYNLGRRPICFLLMIATYGTSMSLTPEYDPGSPLTYFNDGGSPSDFFGSEILAKSDFLGL